MIRLAATAVIALLANALALVVSALVLDDMALQPVGFTIALLIFTAAAVLFSPLIRQVAVKNAPVLLGSTALVSTLVALVITNLLTDDFRISGLTTWVLATIIVWVVALVGRILLPLVLFKKVLAHRSSQGSPGAHG